MWFGRQQRFIFASANSPPPFVLAYIDVDAGPRVLAQVVGGNEVPAGSLVRFTGEENGNLTVKAVGQ